MRGCDTSSSSSVRARRSRSVDGARTCDGLAGRRAGSSRSAGRDARRPGARCAAAAPRALRRLRARALERRLGLELAVAAVREQGVEPVLDEVGGAGRRGPARRPARPPRRRAARAAASSRPALHERRAAPPGSCRARARARSGRPRGAGSRPAGRRAGRSPRRAPPSSSATARWNARGRASGRSATDIRRSGEHEQHDAGRAAAARARGALPAASCLSVRPAPARRPARQPPRRERSSATSAGPTSNRSPTTNRSAISAIGRVRVAVDDHDRLRRLHADPVLHRARTRRARGTATASRPCRSARSGGRTGSSRRPPTPASPRRPRPAAPASSVTTAKPSGLPTPRPPTTTIRASSSDASAPGLGDPVEDRDRRARVAPPGGVARLDRPGGRRGARPSSRSGRTVTTPLPPVNALRVIALPPRTRRLDHRAVAVPGRRRPRWRAGPTSSARRPCRRGRLPSVVAPSEHVGRALVDEAADLGRRVRRPGLGRPPRRRSPRRPAAGTSRAPRPRRPAAASTTRPDGRAARRPPRASGRASRPRSRAWSARRRRPRRRRRSAAPSDEPPGREEVGDLARRVGRRRLDDATRRPAPAAGRRRRPGSPSRRRAAAGRRPRPRGRPATGSRSRATGRP